LETDLADAKRSAMKAKQRMTDIRDKNVVMHRRLMTLLGHGKASTSPVFTSSAGGDYSGHSSNDDTPGDHQQVTLLPASLHCQVVTIQTGSRPRSKF